MMNILIVGSGGREHAFAWKIKQSPKVNQLYIAPGNAGTAKLGENINIAVTDFEGIKNAIIKHNINLVLIGPEVPLCEGLHDFLKQNPETEKTLIVGPKKIGAQLEGSKDFAKDFMLRHNIPTAAYLSVTNQNLEQGIEFLKTLQSPYVLKADGLAAGKGVLIIDSLDEAIASLKEMLNGQFGDASKKVVIEEFLSGIECSVFAITDGKNYKILPEAKDYKRIGENDTGLNTGGMGAISPVPFVDEEFMSLVERTIIKPTIDGLLIDKIEYNGFVFFGLINCQGTPKVIEYNVRMGDPETEAVMLRIKSDFVELLLGAANGTLNEKNIKIDKRAAVAVMLVSGGYPGNYEKGKKISGIDNTGESIVFHAGTKAEGERVLTDGGRVLAISSWGSNIFEALENSYRNADSINFEGMYFRKDLGFDLK